jgi:hypothetical protein
MSTRDQQTINAGVAATSRSNSRTVSRDPGGPIVKLTTVSFTAPATIADSGNGLAIFAYTLRSTIRVEGSASNNREWTVSAVASDGSSITVAEPNITTESAGALVTILQADS